MMPRLKQISMMPARATLFMPMQHRLRSSKATDSKSSFSFSLSQLFTKQNTTGRGRPPKRQSASLFMQMMEILQSVDTKKKKSTPIDDSSKSRSAVILLATLAMIALGATYYYQNKKSPVTDKSNLKNKKADPSKLKIIDAMRISSAGTAVLPGHTQAHKVSFVNDRGETEYYYYKEPNNRQSLINELVIGSLARLLLGKKVPTIYAVETPMNDKEDHSYYAVISEGLGGSVKRDNLETWAESYSEDEEEIKYGPKHLGEAIAFDMLVGKTDSKLANLVLIRNSEGECYSIDQESALRKDTSFLTNGAGGVRFLCEFDKGTIQQRATKDFLLEDANLNCDPNQTVKDNAPIKFKISPILETAINTDIESGRVAQLYHKFTSLNENDFINVFDQFGTLIHEDERRNILADLKERQTRTREFLASQENVIQSAIRKLTK